MARKKGKDGGCWISFFHKTYVNHSKGPSCWNGLTKGQTKYWCFQRSGSKDPTKEQKESIEALGLMIRQKYGISLDFTL